jgi:predicted enzyme related to lactoylglutathione lyase
MLSTEVKSKGDVIFMAAQLGLAMLVVEDVPSCKTFYTELLGFEVVKDFSSDEFVFLHSRAGGTNLALQDASASDYGVPLKRGGLALGFMVEDADATYRDWQSKSVEILGEVGDMGAGRMFAAKDPAGNYIQVYHLYPQVRDAQKHMGIA